MKRSPSKVLVPALLSALLLQNANAWVFTDQFNYSNGANLGSTAGGGGATWTLSGGDVSQIKVTTASTQTSPSGYAPAAGLGVAVTPTGSRKQTGVPFNGATGIPVADGNVVYASFLLNVRTLPSANMRIAYMHNVAASSAGIEAVISSTGQVGIQKKGSGTTFVSGTPVNSPGTHLVVMRYTFQSGNDEVAIWVDPDSSSYGVNPAPTTGLYAHTTSGGSDMSNAIQYFCIESAAVTGPVFWIDEVYVGTTWADVTPSGAPVPPSITSQPTNQTVHADENATFSVSATGSTPLRYQWYFNTNSVLNLATNSTLIITNAQISDAGAYSVLVSNDYGSVTSSYATLSIDTNPVPPTFTLQPTSQIVLPGETATFTAAASGTQPITYQWQKNSVDISGATLSSLVLTNAQSSDAGTFTVVASNSAGSVSSDPATLTVTNIVPGDLYVSPTGTDSNPGTPSQPTTLTNAIAHIPAGSTIWMRGGTYTYSYQITIGSTNDGGDGPFRKKIFAYPGEKPVLDFSSQPYLNVTNSPPRGIKVNGANWYLKGLEVYRSADSGIYISGKSNIVELCVAHHNRDTGIQLGRQGSTTPQADWPSDNLILNCDSYDNYDEPPGTGENADGIDCKLTTGSNNVLRGCISHNNIDDGYDLFTTTDPIGPVIIDQCISYNNGTLTSGISNPNGDRNGFKLGGSDIPVDHVVTRCIAFGNGKNGFAYNSNPGVIRVINNLAFNNAQGNYKFDVAGPIFYNNLSLWTSGSGVNDRYGGASGIATGPSNIFWFNGATKNDSGRTVSTASFQSLTVPPGGFTRNADGSPNLGNFAKLVNGSPLINAGTLPPTNTVTLPYDASTAYEGAPDLGARESYSATAPTTTTNPISQTVLIGSNVTFSVAATGTAPLSYQWRKNSVDISNATNTTFTILNAQPSDAGQYSAVASNSAGTATSNPATLSVLSAFQFWQFQYFGCTNCSQSAADSDPDGDGMDNESEFLAGTSPTNSLSALRITSVVPQGSDMVIEWNTASGRTNRVQATAGASGYTTNSFVDLSEPIIIPGTVETVTTNYTDVGGATNVPSRFYRVRVEP